MSDDTEMELRKYPHDSSGDIPRQGFITPHERHRFEFIQNVAGRTAAMEMYALVREGGYANTEEVLKTAIHSLYRSEAPRNEESWRYHCECGFFGASERTYTAAESGAKAHSDVCEEGEFPDIFRYDPDDWDPEQVEELTEQGRVRIESRD